MCEIRLHRKTIYWLVLVLSIILTFSCTRQLQLQVLKPAELDTRSIQKVAVGSFELARIYHVSKLERNGKWQEKQLELTSNQQKALSNQIRAQVISALATVPYFNIVYTDEFAALENDNALQDAIAAGGFKTADVDAVINGKVWLDVIRTDGVDIDKTELEFKQGGREGAFNYDLEVLAYWPYKAINGNLALELKLTRLTPTEVIAVTFDSRSYSHKIGGKPVAVNSQLQKGLEEVSQMLANSRSATASSDEIEGSDLVLPNFEQLIADLSQSIAAQFIRKVSISRETANYDIASGGNAAAVLLMESGAYEKAIAVLTETLDKASQKNPDDLYNLGLCFEASGDYGLAAVAYNDALKENPDSLLYAQGIGRIGLLKRENRRLRQQLSSRQN